MYTEPCFSLLFYIGVKLRFFVVSGDHRLRVFDNRALRKMSGAKREEVTGEWRTFHQILYG
jgi:hypothetical protein